MLRIGRVALLFLITGIINVQATRQRETSLGVISKLLGKHTGSPLVLVIDRPSNRYNKPLRSNDDRDQDNQNVTPNDEVNEENAQRYVNEILRSTGDANDPNVQRANEKFENALRSRCNAYLECKIKCPKQKKHSCQKGCQETYDYLLLCNRPKNPCEKPKCKTKYGKTLPPSWRF